MKKLFLFFLALLFPLAACSPQSTPAPYTVNNEFGWGCVLGDYYYEDFGARTVYLTPDGKREGLCRDPLCTHSYEADGLCPDVAAMATKSFTTDGTRLYFASIMIWQANAGLKRGIYSILPDGTDFKMLYEGEIAPNNSWDLVVSDGYLYFVEGHFNEDYDPSSGWMKVTDQYGYIFRIPVNGGRAEQMTHDRADVGSAFTVYRNILCRVRVGQDGNLAIERIDLGTGETEWIPLPGEMEGAWPRFLDGVLYLTAGEYSHTLEADRGDGSTASTSGRNWFLYRLVGDEWECLAESESRFVFAGDEVWFVRDGEPEYLGTKAFPTGKGSETVDRDIFDTHARRLFALDLKTGETAELSLSADIAPSESIELTAVGETVVYMMLSDPHLLLEGKPSKTLVCADRKTLSVIWRCDP